MRTIQIRGSTGILVVLLAVVGLITLGLIHVGAQAFTWGTGSCTAPVVQATVVPVIVPFHPMAAIVASTPQSALLDPGANVDIGSLTITGGTYLGVNPGTRHTLRA